MKAEVKTVIVLLIIALVVVLYVAFLAPTPAPDKYKAAVRFENIKDKMNTGDLIFLTGNTFFEKGIRCATGCVFSHIGMVVRKPGNKNTLYLWEADLGQRAKPGPRFIPLEEKLQYYRGLCKGGVKIGAWIKLNPATPVDYDTVKRIIDENMDKTMQNRFYTYFLSGFPESRIYQMVKDDNKVFCSELIADTYQKLAIIDGKHIPSYFTPDRFLKKNFNLQPGVSMSDPVYFEFH